MGKNIGKNIIKNSSDKYGQKHLNHAKKSATDAIKGALSGLRHFLATESPLKVMKNDFYFTS